MLHERFLILVYYKSTPPLLSISSVLAADNQVFLKAIGFTKNVSQPSIISTLNQRRTERIER